MFYFQHGIYSNLINFNTWITQVWMVKNKSIKAVIKMWKNAQICTKVLQKCAKIEPMRPYNILNRKSWFFLRFHVHVHAENPRKWTMEESNNC